MIKISLSNIGKLLIGIAFILLIVTEYEKYRLAQKEKDEIRQKIKLLAQTLKNTIKILDELYEKSPRSIQKEVKDAKNQLLEGLAAAVMDFPKGASVSIPQAQGRIEILSPQNDSQAGDRAFVEGTISGYNGKVWVVVHPVGTSAFWVQPNADITENGKWSVNVYLGRPGNIDIGKRFEIMAVANPAQEIRTGIILENWPEAGWRSQVINVVRK
jgi:uncharacterized protein YoxC